MLYFLLYSFVYSLSPSSSLLDSLFETFNNQEKSLFVARPIHLYSSLERTLVSSLHQKLLLRSQTNRLLLIGINLGVTRDSFVSRNSLSLLDKLKDEDNICFLDIYSGIQGQPIASHIDWKDRKQRYFVHRQRGTGLFRSVVDNRCVQKIMKQTNVNQVIIWGCYLQGCIYETIRSWSDRFFDYPIELIFSLSIGDSYEKFDFSKQAGTENYLLYLKQKTFVLFDLDFYERDESNQVYSINFLGDISRKYLGPHFVVWRLKTERQLASLFMNLDSPESYYQGNLLETLPDLVKKPDGGLIVTAPSQLSNSFQETIVSEVYRRLSVYAQTKKLFLIGIDLGVLKNSFLKKPVVSLLEKLKDEVNIYFLDVSYGKTSQCQSVASHIDWTDRGNRYFEYRKRETGLFQDDEDYFCVKQMIDTICPDRIVFFGYNLTGCVYDTIVSWSHRFENQPVYLIYSLSSSNSYDFSIFSRKTHRACYVFYLRNRQLTLLDLDFYERDEEDCVRYIDSQGGIMRLFSNPQYVIWRLKSQNQIDLLVFS